MNLVKTIARHLLVSMGVGLLFNGAMAQDTTVVQTFTFDSTGRSEFFVFPDDPNKKYEKILMQYRMRCKNALVSDANDRNKGCGEWDYSCNTYLWDSTNIDSLKYLADDYRISNFSGSTFNYSSTPVYDYYLTWQQNVTVNSIVSETQSTVGTGNAADVDALSTLYYTGKSQYLITAAELTAAGVVAGTIDGLMLNVTGTGGPTDFLSVRMKASSKTNLYATDPEFSNFVEVYHSNTTLTNGSNRLQFHTLYNWDGTSNIIVELAFKNPGFSTAITLEGSNINGFGIASAGDQSFYFNGNNYVEALTYKGIGGTDERTVEAWIKTTTPDKEIVSWGRNSAGQKFVFRLDGSGRVRVEVNGGSIIGTTVLTDGEWHHVACTFNGSDVTDFKLYADGNLEAVSGSTPEPVNTNTTNGINVRISRGVNNRYWVGEIDDVRIWNKALSASVISDYMHQIVDPNHPDFQNLEAYYRFNTPTGETVSDATANAYQAKVVSGSNWHKMNALEIHKGFKNTQTRPNFTFLQGNYNLTVVGDSIFDSIAQFTNFVEELQVVSHPGVLQDDELQVLNSNHYWGEGYAYYFDESGVKYDSVAIQTDGSVSITIDALEYFRRFASKFELMSFVTPYGIGLDLGVDGKMWEFDMTDFTPVLKGGKRISLERGGQNQEEMDIRFLFIEGTPERDVIDIKQVWKVDARSYTDILSNKYFAPVDYPLDPTATTYKLRTAITGHGQEGEFIPRSHFIDLNGAGNEFTWDVWMECGENPVYPQGGTWIYDRAGWCPGMATDLRENEITNYVTPGTTVNIDYGLSTASGDSRYIVNHQLVSYGDANFSTNASVVDIISPSTKVEHARFNENCTSLRIKIRNSGSEDIKNMKINYWINGSTTPFVHSWIGNMAYLQEQEVSLPIPAGFWNGVSPSDNTFHVEVVEVNGGVDDYTANNVLSSTFDAPEIVPNDIILHFRTNNAAGESAYELRDHAGNILFSRSNLSNSTTYRDTFNLIQGKCYQLIVTDSDDDGIDFWANNDGAGQLRIYELGGSPVAFKTFEGDFGDGINYNFTAGVSVSVPNLTDKVSFDVYPNPAKDQLNVDAFGFSNEVKVEIYNSLGKLVYSKESRVEESLLNSTFSIAHLATGMYTLRVADEKTIRSKSFIKQ